MGLRDQEEESPAHGSESSTAGIHVPSSVLSSLKALWHVVGAVSTHQIRVDFWERLVVSGGRVARCWMQEAAFKVWSLEQGNLMPEPRPTLTPPPTSALPAFLLELSHTLSPSPRPCHPGSSAHLETQTLGVPEGLLAFSICLSQGSSAWASRACLLGAF